MEDKTIQILRSTLEKSPDLWETRQHLAELLWAAGDVQGTSDVLSHAPQWPSDEANLEFAASVFAHTNRTYAVDLYNAVVERNARNARAHVALARLHMDAGERDVTREHYTAATAIDPSLAEPQIAFWLQNGDAPHPVAVAEAPPAEPAAAPAAAPAASAAPAAPAAPAAAPAASAVSLEKATPKSIPDPPGSAIDPPPLKVPSSVPDKCFGEQFNMAMIDARTGLAHEQQEHELAEAEKKKQIASLIVAAVVHVAIGALLALWILHALEDTPVLVITQADANMGPPKVEKKNFAKAVRRKPNPASSSARAQIITSNVAAPILVEEVEEIDPDAFGVANNFGKGMGFGNGDGGGGGSVMFFGSGGKINHGVFIVDFSGSMSQGSRISMLKRELDSSISKLVKGTSYNIIYYSHRPWLGGENVGSAPFRDPDDPKDRIPWVIASPDTIQKSREEIANMQLGGATNWIPPVSMALAMRPSPRAIWLLTDGEASDREEMIADMASINPNKVKINTIGMEIGGPTFQSLIEIAEMTGGTYSIVMGGKLYTGGAARKFTDPQFVPNP